MTPAKHPRPDDANQIADDEVPSGYQKVDTPEGAKIVREGPVSFVRRELAMSPNRQRLWEKHQAPRFYRWPGPSLTPRLLRNRIWMWLRCGARTAR